MQFIKLFLSIKQGVIVALFVFGLSFLAACSLHIPIEKKQTSKSKHSKVESRRPQSHYVKHGDTLYSIAFRYGLEFRALAAWNNIPYPYTIYPKQRVALFPTKKPTKKSNKSTEKKPKQVPVVKQPITTTAKKPPQKTQVKTYPKQQKPTSTAVVKKTTQQPKAKTTMKKPVVKSTGKAWQWPTQGKIYRTFSAKNSARKGIDVVGKEGQSVTAAKAGLIVYSGNGLPGYGELIIIKHDENYLSAYGYNKKRLVKEGETVQAGQTIAKMGQSIVDKRPMLHFEIRYKSKPVNPLKYLPKR